MDEKIKRLADTYLKTEIHEGKWSELLRELNNLNDEECNCKDIEIVNLIHEGKWLEIMTRCLNCGGYVERME